MKHEVIYEQEGIIIRKYQASDCKALAELFYRTVHTINARDYTSQQLHAWADGHVDLENWNKSLLEHYTLVAEVLIACREYDSVSASIHDAAHPKSKGIIVGFGDIACLDDVEHTGQIGYLDRLYVHADYQRQGIASRLCELLESAALKNYDGRNIYLKKLWLRNLNLKKSELESLTSGAMTTMVSILKPPVSKPHSEKSNGSCGVIVTHASITARPFFKKIGYRVKKEQIVIRHGVALKNFVMEKAVNLSSITQ